MEITKKYFDEQFSKVSKKFDKIDQRFDIVDSKIDVLDTKIDSTAKDLKSYIHESFETQQIYLDVRFGELMEELKIEQRLDGHETWMRAVGSKVGVKFYNRTQPSS